MILIKNPIKITEISPKLKQKVTNYFEEEIDKHIKNLKHLPIGDMIFNNDIFNISIDKQSLYNILKEYYNINIIYSEIDHQFTCEIKPNEKLKAILSDYSNYATTIIEPISNNHYIAKNKQLWEIFILTYDHSISNNDHQLNKNITSIIDLLKEHLIEFQEMHQFEYHKQVYHPTSNHLIDKEYYYELYPNLIRENDFSKILDHIDNYLYYHQEKDIKYWIADSMYKTQHVYNNVFVNIEQEVNDIWTYKDNYMKLFNIKLYKTKPIRDSKIQYPVPKKLTSNQLKIIGLLDNQIKITIRSLNHHISNILSSEISLSLESAKRLR